MSNGQGKLIICPTPIGNRGDMSPRSLEALQAADAVFAEDTRVTGKLLTMFGIEGKPVQRLDENLMEQQAAHVLSLVHDGQVIAYCSDAGMPGVSDPGLRLVRMARESGLPVEVLPGPTAVTTAYVASGTDAQAFYFGGFFPRKDKARVDLLRSLSELDAALVFYESPNRIASSLATVSETFPLRQVTVCRELTKLHEEVVRGLAPDVAKEFASRDSVKGEIVMVIDSASQPEKLARTERAADAAKRRARELKAAGDSPKTIARVLGAEFDISRNEAYNIALNCDT